MDILLESFAKVKLSVSDVKLLLVGDGKLRASLELLASELKISDDVIFAGSNKSFSIFSF